MANLKYTIKLLGLHMMSGCLAMMFCINAKFLLDLIIEGKYLFSIFTLIFAGIAYFACMMMAIFKTFYVWASRQKNPGDY